MLGIVPGIVFVLDVVPIPVRVHVIGLVVGICHVPVLVPVVGLVPAHGLFMF